MPPKTRIEKEKIVQAAFEIAREKGIDGVNARSVASRLKCSTQPVLYAFSSIQELKKAVYNMANEFHSSYIMNIQGSSNPMVEIGLLYVDFAYNEKNLFKLLFQTDSLGREDILSMMDSEDINQIIEVVAQSLQTGFKEAKAAFLSHFLLVHGIASLMANNSLSYDKDLIQRIITDEGENNEE